MGIFNKDKKGKKKEKERTINGPSSSVLQSIKSLDDEINTLRKRKERVKKSFDKTFSDIDKDKNEKMKLRKKLQEFVEGESKIRVKRKALVEEMKKISKQENKISNFKRKMSDL